MPTGGINLAFPKSSIVFGVATRVVGLYTNTLARPVSPTQVLSSEINSVGSLLGIRADNVASSPCSETAPRAPASCEMNMSAGELLPSSRI